MLVAITTQQQRLLQTIYDAFKETGEWPRLQYVETTLHHDHRIDLRTVLDILPEGLTNLSPGFVNPQIEVTLTLAGLARCSGAEADLGLFWRLLRRCVDEDGRFRPPPSSPAMPKVRITDLATEWAIPISRFARLVKILDFEPWAYMSNKVSDEDWELLIHSTIRQFESVKSLEEYLDRRASLARRTRAGRIAAAPIDQESTRASAQESARAIHISISGGTVGTLNFGQVIGDIETHVNAVTGGSADQFKRAVKEIVESIERDGSLTEAAKAGALEFFDYLAEAAASAPPIRKLSIIRRVLVGIGETFEDASDAHAVWDRRGPIVRRFFGLLEPQV